jgi:signal transduction histidine kinase
VVVSALRESEELSSMAQAGGHLGTWTLDPDDRRLTGSDEWARIHDAPAGTAWSLEAWCGRVDAADRGEVEAAWAASLAEGIGFEREYRFHCDSGVVRWFWSKGHAHRDASAAIVRFAGVTLDVSERKATERELLRAKEAAESANVAKSAFLANMSHEIRTPLNAITGMAYLMHRAGLDDAQAQRLSRIESAGRHLTEIVADVLDIAKIEAEKVTIVEECVDVGAIAAEVAAMVAERARTKGLRGQRGQVRVVGRRDSRGAGRGRACRSRARALRGP